MRSTRNRRGRSARIPTVREIKQAICGHERLAPVGPSTQGVPGGVWHTRVACPSCGAWEVRETPDTALLPLTGRETMGVEPTWETCAVELRCAEHGARVFPLCRYDAMAQGPAGRYVAGRSAEFDNGLERAERAAIIAALGHDLTTAGWEPVAVSTDPMPHFRRRLGAAADTPALA